MDVFEAALEANCKKLYDSLGEKDARRYAGNLYHLSGDMSYVCNLLSISDKTVRKGLDELNQEELTCSSRQRHSGGGRKSKWDCPELNAAFNEIIKPHTAGDPMNPDVKWTNLSRAEIIDLLDDKGFKISKNTIKKMLQNNDFKKRKIQKRKSLKVVEDRDAQFNEINKARQSFVSEGQPVISVDTKKKKL